MVPAPVERAGNNSYGPPKKRQVFLVLPLITNDESKRGDLLVVKMEKY